MLQSLILIDVQSSAFWEKRKKERERNGQGFFSSQGRKPDIACWLCLVGFLQLLSVIKG
jgi:hypothetical protein